jgi:hypothetical protein
MIETQPRPTIRTLVASFLFTDLVGFSKGTAADQFAAKAKLSGVLRRHLAALKESDYWIKDTGDGALIAFVSNPEHALYMALALAQDYGAGAADVASGSLRTGLHLGTVKESIDVEARRNFIGDGINAAKRIMDFALPGQLTASRSFFEAIANLDAAYAALFQHVGAPDDKHGRAHELYTLSPSASVLERLRGDLSAEAGTRPDSSSAQTSASAAAPPATDRRVASSLRAALIVGAVALVVAAISMTMWWHESTQSALPVVAPPRTSPEASTGVKKAPEVATPPLTGTTSAAPPPSAPTAGSDSSMTSPTETTEKRATESTRASSASPAPPRAASEVKRRVVAPVPGPATTTTGPSSPRCTRIVEKAALGEPLTPEEKRELANSCR